MKKIALIVFAALAAAFSLKAQNDAREEVFADIEKTGGVHYMYPMNQPAPTAAPKGYKAFYLSHVGRHGARFALGSTIYNGQWSTWSRAHTLGWLTPEGEEIYEAWAALMPNVLHREGNLTQKGQAQHKYIASQIYKNYPDVFAGPTHASAVSTVSHRVIVSMFTFLSELDNLDSDFTFDADYGYPYQDYLLPEIIDQPRVWPDSVRQKLDVFMAERVDEQAILSRWFTQPGHLVSSPYTFLYDLLVVVSTLDNLDCEVPQKFYSIFTPEERYNIWEVSNYDSYLLLGRSPEVDNVRTRSMKALLKDFIDKTEEDLASGEVQLRLRFAHDSTLMPFLSLVGVNDWGVVASCPDELTKHWRTFEIPMGANLQLIFFKNKKQPGDILFQLLLNGVEATLPLEMAAPGSFYRWADLKAVSAALL